jgi:hypothetical protein
MIKQGDELARQERLELPTRCLEGSCSILLSYWRVLRSQLPNYNAMPDIFQSVIRGGNRGERIRTADLLLPRQAR